MKELQLTGINPTKNYAEQMADEIAAMIEDGTEQPIQLAIKLNCLEAAIKSAKAKIQPDVLDAINMYSERHISIMGAKIEKAEVATKYDYSADDIWQKLNADSIAAADILKAHEDRLKKIEPGKLLVDSETGDTLTGPAKESKSSYKITLGK